MWSQIMSWLLAGSPAHYQQLLAVVAFLIIEDVLPRIKAIKGNSTVQCIIDLLYPVLVKVPYVRIVAKLASPQLLFPDPPKGTAPMHDSTGMK